MAQITTAASIGLTEIGGPGEMVYRAVRFSGYAPYTDNDRRLAMAYFPSPFDPCTIGIDYRLTGQSILESLLLLFHELNDAGGHEDIEPRVFKWCTENLHPYNINDLCELAEVFEPGTSLSALLQKDSVFSVEDFLKDLCDLGNTFWFWHALDRIKTYKDPKEARQLYYEGRLRDRFSFFEKYRDIEDDDEYVNEVMADYGYHIEMLLGLFPDFRMRLKMDEMTHRIMYGADINSVFDIAWYTFARMAADDAPPVDEDLNYMTSQGSILFCLCCGKPFIRHSSRQLYCSDPDCQAYKNRKNRNASYARNRAKQVRKKD